MVIPFWLQIIIPILFNKTIFESPTAKYYGSYRLGGVMFFVSLFLSFVGVIVYFKVQGFLLIDVMG